MKKTTFIIPKQDNNGKKFPAKVLVELRWDILEQVGGYTVRDVDGAWFGRDGNTYHDSSWGIHSSDGKRGNRETGSVARKSKGPLKPTCDVARGPGNRIKTSVTYSPGEFNPLPTPGR